MFKNKVFKIIIIGWLLICAILAVTQGILIFKAKSNLISAIKLYLYDGSTVFQKLKEPKIKNEYYLIGTNQKNAGEYVQAIDNFNAALEQMQIDHMADDVRIAYVHLQIGSCYYSLKDYVNSYDHFMNAYITHKSKFGDKSESANEIKSFLGAIEVNTGRYEEAIKDLKDSFECVKYYGSRINIVHDLSNALYSTGQLYEALEWLNHGLAYFNCLQGRPNYEVYSRKSALETLCGHIYRCKADYQSAEKYYLNGIDDVKTAIEISSDRKKRLYKNLSDDYLQLADMYAEQFDFSKSLSCLEVAEKNIQDYVLDDIDTLFNLCRIKSSKESSEAFANLGEKQVEYLKAIRQNGIPTKFLNTNISDNIYMIALSMAWDDALLSKKDPETEEFLLDALDKMKQMAGEHSVIVSNQLLLLAHYYMGIDNAKALDYCNKAIENQKDILNIESQTMLCIYTDAYAIYLSLDAYDKAIEMILKSLEICCNVNGCNSYKTVECLSNILMALEKQTQNEAKLIISELALNICEQKSIDKNDFIFETFKSEAMADINNTVICQQCINRAENLSFERDNKLFVKQIGEIILK